jgi:hypothetical protein
MLHTGAIIALALALAACADAPEHAVEHVLDRHVEGGPDHAFVPGYPNSLDALPFAMAHCSRFGKAARFRRLEHGGALFDCVEK